MTDPSNQPTPARGTERMPRHGHLISHAVFEDARERRENRLRYCKFLASLGLVPTDEMIAGAVDALHEVLR